MKYKVTGMIVCIAVLFSSFYAPHITGIEIKLPWHLLNFAAPSRMTIHDDYYDDNYGVDYITIDEMFVGLSSGEEKGRISLNSVPLKGLAIR